MTPEDAGNAEVKLENTVLEGKEGKDPIGQALPLLQEAQQATKGQIAATNAAQADAAVAEQMQPINQAVDFLNLYNQRQAAELAREKEKEDKRIRWERLGHDIASIAASVGDMTRASEGAPVSPRDWQQTYDNLSAQARANIDNYRVRMAKIHEDEKAARMAQAQAQAKAIGDRQKQDFDIKKLMLELGWKGDQASFERALKILLNDQDNASRENIAYINANGSGGGRAQTNIPMFGTVKFIDASQNDNTLLALYGQIKKLGLDFGIEDALLGSEKVQEIKAKVLPTLQNAVKTQSGTWIVTYPTKIQGGGWGTTSKELTQEQVNDLINYVDIVSGKIGASAGTPAKTNGGSPEPSNATPPAAQVDSAQVGANLQNLFIKRQ